MFRLVRMNEVQYADSEFQRDVLIEEGFILDIDVEESTKPKAPNTGTGEGTDNEGDQSTNNAGKDLKDLSRDELVALAKEKGAKGTSQLNMEELIAFLQG